MNVIDVVQEEEELKSLLKLFYFVTLLPYKNNSLLL